jgi:predicted Holliday junction resolvase-like endonuclease
MEPLLLALVALLLIVLVVSWARAGTIAHGRFERWRETELDRVRSESTLLAQDAARVELARWQAEQETAIRRDAIARSSSVVLGKATEHLAPFLATFPYSPRDVRFIGSPVDLVVFDGLDAGEMSQVVFVEVKSGAGQLSSRQRQVREAVRAGRVSWEEWRLPGA